MRLRSKLAAAAALTALAGLVPASPASAAPHCGTVPQLPFRTEIGNTRVFTITSSIYVTCDVPIVSTTANGTLTRNGTPYDVIADTQTDPLTPYFVLHQKVTACPPATQAVYTSSISIEVVTTAGAELLPAATRSATINCALF
jgi:hypothetical protein